MSNSRSPKRRTPPFSIRLTAEERATLEDRADGIPLGAFVKSVLFAENAASYRNAHRAVPADRQALGQLLAALGASRLASNLNQLAKAANQGALPVTVETEADLRQACAGVAEMRALLLRALSVKTDSLQEAAPPLSPIFKESAGVPHDS
jgi:hypothetical protein